jgi:hypothetical protein
MSPLGLDGEVEHARPGGGERLPDGRHVRGLADAEEAAAAARAADLAAVAPAVRAASQHRIDGRRRHAWREPLAVLPFLGDLAPDLGPVAGSSARRMATAMSRIRAKRPGPRGPCRCGAW